MPFIKINKILFKTCWWPWLLDHTPDWSTGKLFLIFGYRQALRIRGGFFCLALENQGKKQLCLAVPLGSLFPWRYLSMVFSCSIVGKHPFSSELGRRAILNMSTLWLAFGLLLSQKWSYFYLFYIFSIFPDPSKWSDYKSMQELVKS